MHYRSGESLVIPQLQHGHGICHILQGLYLSCVSSLQLQPGELLPADVATENTTTRARANFIALFELRHYRIDLIWGSHSACRPRSAIDLRALDACMHGLQGALAGMTAGVPSALLHIHPVEYNK